MLKKFRYILDDINERYIYNNGMNQKHVALILSKNGKVVSVGINTLLLTKEACSEHAEEAALIKMRKRKMNTEYEKRDRYDILVVRITKGGQFAESRPCPKCIERMRKSGIKINRVYYTTRKRTLMMEKLNEMKCEMNYSTGYRYLRKCRGHEQVH